MNKLKFFSYICIVIIAVITSKEIRGNTINRLDLAATKSGLFNYMKKLNYIGDVYGKLTIISKDELDKTKRQRKYVCKCECGNLKSVYIGHLRGCKIVSCGCYFKSIGTTHGLHSHKLYPIWSSMVARCVNENHKAYNNYGGRGIKVCDRWLNSPSNFIEDMIGTYKHGLSIDRIDNNKGYEPTNCKWSTRIEQSNNKRVNISVLNIENGVYYNSISEAARAFNIGESSLRSRINRKVGNFIKV